MDLKITDLMDFITDDSVALADKKTASADKVTELTLRHIRKSGSGNENPEQPSDRSRPRHAHIRLLRRAILLAACFVILIVGSITALAKAGVIDFGGFYASIFENPKAAKAVATGKDISGVVADSGIEIKPLDAYVEGYSAYIRLQLHDAQGGRLSGSICLLEKGGDSAITPLVDYNAGTNTAVAVVSKDVPGGDSAPATAELDLTAICADIRAVSEQTLDFNVGANIGMTQPIAVPGAEFMEITGIETHGNQLTIHQSYNDIAKYGWNAGLLGLKAPDGTVIWQTTSSKQEGSDAWSVVFDLGKHNPKTLSSLVYKGNHAARTITGNWKISFSSVRRIVPRTLTADFSGRKVQISCGATELKIDITPGYKEDDPEARNIAQRVRSTEGLSMTLKNGEKVNLRFSSIGWYSKSMDMNFIMAFIQPEDVESITLLGQKFTFSN